MGAKHIEIGSAHLGDLNVIGLVTNEGMVILNDMYLDCGLQTILYENFCSSQLKHGCDCMGIKDGDDLRVTKLKKLSRRILRTGA